MDQIKLNKENPVMEFQLNSEDSHLLIQSVSIKSPKNDENQRSNFISKVKLIAELKYVVFDESEGRFIDERNEQFPIHLVTDPYQVQPVFQLNKLIKNKTLTLGINREQKFYNILKIALKDHENLDENYTLEFNIKKFKIDD